MPPSINLSTEDSITAAMNTHNNSTSSFRDRSTSITASQHTRTSSSSDERKSRKHKKKPSAFKSFFAVKEPSAVAFQNLAQAMKEEIGEKGHLPFGVPAGKIPASADADYKKAKENAKEKARWHREAKEQLRRDQEHEKAMAKALMVQSQRPKIVVDNRTEEELLRDQLQETAGAISYVSLDPRPTTSSGPSALSIPSPAHRKSSSTHSRWKAPSLTSLPETTRSTSSAHSSPSTSMPVTPSSPARAPSDARAEVAPWEVTAVESISVPPKKTDVAPWEEEDEEEEFPIRKGAKNSKSYFSTLIRR